MSRLIHRQQHHLIVAGQDHAVEARVEGPHILRGELGKLVESY